VELFFIFNRIFDILLKKQRNFMQTIIKTDLAPTPVGPYSQAVKAGPFLFCSGQIAIDPKTNQVVLGSVQDQAELVMKNIEGVLKAAGVNWSQIVKTNIFLLTMDDFPKVNEVYGRYFPNNPPARSTIAVAALPKGVSVEIEVTALLS
jgi:2-iminobutanoate/2-iminopropanoate deaminase